MSNGRKLRLGLDVDGVLADFVGSMLYDINRVYPRANGQPYVETDVVSWAIEDVLESTGSTSADIVRREHVRRFMQKPGFARDLRVLPGARSAVQRLQAQHEVWAVTSPVSNSPTWMWDRAEWLKSHFGIDDKRIVQTGDKACFDGDMLVDDRLSNLTSWLESMEDRHGPKDVCGAVLWSRPWNAREVLRPEIEVVGSWAGVEAHARLIAKDGAGR